MTDLRSWNQSIYNALARLSDKKYQEKIWLDNSDQFKLSPDELYYMLIEDNVFDEYIINKDLNLSSYQKEEAQQFIKDFDDYYDSYPGEYLDPQKIINDPKWDIIRQKAKRLIDTLNLDKYKDTNY